MHRASLILTLLAAHPDVAAAPISWTIDDRPELWPSVPYNKPEAKAAAEVLAQALGVRVETDVTPGSLMYSVYGTWQGVEVNLHAWGPKDEAPSETAEAVSA
ncbi:MAG: hypothetical protein HOY76_51480 [Streptomyces sp.]|nr:hypothetical protein [Streptomyces sp.]